MNKIADQSKQFPDKSSYSFDLEIVSSFKLFYFDVR